MRFHDTVLKHLHHPVVGDLDLNFNRLDIPGEPGLSVTTYTAEPGSRSAEALALLGSWGATVEKTDAAAAGA